MLNNCSMWHNLVLALGVCVFMQINIRVSSNATRSPSSPTRVAHIACTISRWMALPTTRRHLHPATGSVHRPAARACRHLIRVVRLIRLLATIKALTLHRPYRSVTRTSDYQQQTRLAVWTQSWLCRTIVVENVARLATLTRRRLMSSYVVIMVTAAGLLRLCRLHRITTATAEALDRQ